MTAHERQCLLLELNDIIINNLLSLCRAIFSRQLLATTNSAFFSAQHTLTPEKKILGCCDLGKSTGTHFLLDVIVVVVVVVAVANFMQGKEARQSYGQFGALARPQGDIIWRCDILPSLVPV